MVGDKEAMHRRCHTVFVGDGEEGTMLWGEEARERKAFTGAGKERSATYPRYPGLTEVTHDIYVLIEI